MHDKEDNPSLEDIRRKLDDLSTQNSELLRTRLLQASVSAYGQSCAETDRFSTWLMVGTGAALALAIPNLQELEKVVGWLGLKYGLLLILTSLAAGLFQRLTGFRILSESVVEMSSKAASGEELKLYHQAQNDLAAQARNLGIALKPPDPMAVQLSMDQLVSYLPAYLRWYANRAREKARSDPNFFARRRVRLIVRQGLLLVLQFLSLIIGLALILLNM
jgi:hypothetical protein